MTNGLNYEEANKNSNYYKYLEPSLKIFEEFYEYLNKNGYERIIVQDFSIHACKKGTTVQLLFDISKYNQYVLRIWNHYNVIFIYEDGVYKLKEMDENKQFDNIYQIIEYTKMASGKEI